MQEISGDKSFKVLSQDIYILFYFGASWCKPCQIILPLMDNLIQQYDKNTIQFYKIDIDLEENNLLCDKCKIKVVPAFLLFKGRNFINRTKGNNIEAVRKMINDTLQPNENELGISNIDDKQVNEGDNKSDVKDPFIANKEIFNKDRLFK